MPNIIRQVTGLQKAVCQQLSLWKKQQGGGTLGGCLQEAACERQDGATLLASFHKVLVKAGFATEPDGLDDPAAHVRATWEKVHASEEVPNQFHG